MNLVQRQQFGLAEGAKRYAECMFLLNTMTELGHVYEQLKTYLEMLQYWRWQFAIKHIDFPTALVDIA